jgi:DNA repair protein RecO (recombination protein O)
MTLVATPAVVLRTYRYSETSKIVRLATRDLGVQSAIAKGALRPNSRFGAGLELLSEGTAQLYHRDNRELQTLAAFDVERLRRELAADVGRFAAAAALAELMVRLAPPAPLPAGYDTLTSGLDGLVAAGVAEVESAGLRALWLLLGVLGFEPSLRRCARDGARVAAEDTPVPFSSAEGGVLCAACATANPPPGVTRLPVAAWRDLCDLLDPAAALPHLDALHAAAHRRLAARFARHHLDDQGPGTLPALEFWERRPWGGGGGPAFAAS